MSAVFHQSSRRSAVFAILLIAGCSPTAPPTDQGREIALSFLQKLQDKNEVENAWQSTSAEFKSMQGAEEFQAYVKKHPMLTRPATFQKLTPIDRQGLKLAECQFTPTEGGGAILVTLAREQGVWKVEKLEVK